MNDDHMLTVIRNQFAEAQDSLGEMPTAVPASEIFAQVRNRRRRGIAALTAAAGTAGLAIIATVVGITSSASPSRPAIDKGAVQLLSKVAETAARQPAPHVRDGQYMYVETTAAVPSNVPANWTFPRHMHLKMINERSWVPVCISANGKKGDIGSLNHPTYRLLQTLPTNPHALLALIYRVERGHGPGPAQEAFVTIGDLLGNTIAPPKVAAALYRAAALIPGVTLVPQATDAIGRHGVAVGRVGPGAYGGVREELIFSRATLQLIGERTVIPRIGEVTGATAIIDRAFVDHWRQVPSPDKRTTS
jgi:hypothetical protein